MTSLNREQLPKMMSRMKLNLIIVMKILKISLLGQLTSSEDLKEFLLLPKQNQAKRRRRQELLLLPKLLQLHRILLLQDHQDQSMKDYRILQGMTANVMRTSPGTFNIAITSPTLGSVISRRKQGEVADLSIK